MQTFKLSLGIDIKAIITQEFLDESRKEAQAEDASPFLKECQARFPEDDDQFMLMIVCNAFRTKTRHDITNFMLASGVGGTVSPVEILDREVHVPKVFSETPPAEPADRPLKEGTLTLGFVPDVPPIAAQHIVEAVISQDGDKVCTLVGDDLVSGVAGFGDTEAEARADLAENLLK